MKEFENLTIKEIKEKLEEIGFDNFKLDLFMYSFNPNSKKLDSKNPFVKEFLKDINSEHGGICFSSNHLLLSLSSNEDK